MRWFPIIFSEVVFFAGALYGLALLGDAPHSWPWPPDAAAALEHLSRSALLPPAREAMTVSIRPADSAAGTFLGMSESRLNERMRRSAVKSLSFNRGGSSISFRVEFQDGSRAAFKPAQTNPQTVPRKEAAAYRLSRLLGLNLVAPVVMRPLHRDEILGKLSANSHWARHRVEHETLFDENGLTLGSLAYWIPQVSDLRLDTNEGVLKWTAWLSQGGGYPLEKEELLSQLSTLLVFDLLQNNSDRFSGGNLLGSPDGKTLYYMDNAFGFQPDPDGNLRCWSYLKRSQKFSKRFVAALNELNAETLRTALSTEPGPPLLSDEEQTALLARRDRALRYIRGLVEQYGSDRVLAFK